MCPIGKSINAELRKFNLNFFFRLESSNRNAVAQMHFRGKDVEMESVFSDTESSIFGTAVFYDSHKNIPDRSSLDLVFYGKRKRLCAELVFYI